MPPTVSKVNNIPPAPVNQEPVPTPVAPQEPSAEVPTTPPEDPKEVPISEEEFLSLSPKQAYQTYLAVLNDRDTTKAGMDKKVYEAAEAIKTELQAKHDASIDEIKQTIKEILYDNNSSTA